jgi:2,4-dichlorophenol 6-monooxygenase
MSTLDLVGHGSFTVVTGIAGLVWVEAAEKCAAEFGIPLPVVRIGAENARDAYGEWRRVGELDEEGALLIRPDGYIAFRQRSVVDSAGALEKLRSALASVLARDEK